MKVKIFVIAALAAILAVAVWMAYEGPAEPSGGDGSGEVRPDSDPESLLPRRPLLAPEQVARIILAGPDGHDHAILVKTDSGWNVENLHSAPADVDKVDALLEILLAAERAYLPPDSDGPVYGEGLGLSADEGVHALLLAGNGEEFRLRIGLRPVGKYDDTYAQDATSPFPFLIHGDVRGAMGLWRNTPDAEPDSRYWLETRVFSFDPEAATSIVATYPDHRLAFTLGENGDWELDGQAPGDEWSPTGLTEWMRELSSFRIASVADPADLETADLESPSHRLDVQFKGGGSKGIRLYPNRAGDGMWAETSDYPGQIFLLPMWRFKRYFQRLAELFPKASPSYDSDSVRLVDIRRGGENVKIVRRDADWRAPSIPFPLRQERVRRLIRSLAEWRAEDYFDPGKGTTIRVAYGGPVVEVVLANGSVHRYRLGGRHPVFPWRYVILDGEVCLAGDEERTMRLFPSFADIFDLGLVFSEIVAGDVSVMEFSQNDGADVLFRADKEDDGSWKGAGEIELTADDIDRIVWKPLTWQASGLFEEDARGGQMPHGMFRIRFVAKDGREEVVTLLSPHGRDIPYVNARGRAMRVSLGDFLSWTRAIRDFGQRSRQIPSPRSEPEKNEIREGLPDSGSLPEVIGGADGTDSGEEEVGFVGTTEIDDWTGIDEPSGEGGADAYDGMLGAAMADEEDVPGEGDDEAAETDADHTPGEEVPDAEDGDVGNAVEMDGAADSTHHVIVAE